MRSFNQLIAEYQERARLADTIEDAIARLLIEDVRFMQAAQVLVQVYALDFDDAQRRLKSYELWQDQLRPSDAFLQLNEKYKEYVRNGANIEQVIVHLHAQHISVGDALKVLRSIFGIDMNEAKNLLLNHPAWIQEHQWADDLYERAINADDPSI